MANIGQCSRYYTTQLAKRQFLGEPFRNRDPFFNRSQHVTTQAPCDVSFRASVWHSRSLYHAKFRPIRVDNPDSNSYKEFV